MSELNTTEEDWDGYGYWVKPDGHLVLVNQEEHEEHIDYTGAGIEGWIRLVVEDEDTCIGLDADTATKQALKTCIQVLSKRRYGQVYMSGLRHDTIPDGCPSFEPTHGQAVKYLRKLHTNASKGETHGTSTNTTQE